MNLKTKLKKGLRKFLPAAASIIAGVAAGPAASIIASFAASKLGEIGIKVSEDELYDFSKEVIKGVGVEVLKDELASILKKEKKLTRGEIQSAVDYVIRPMFARLNEAFELLRSDRDLLIVQLNELDLQVSNIDEKIKALENAQRKILDELKNQQSALNRLFSQIISKLGFRESRDLVASSRIWSQNSIIASAYDYKGIFDKELYVDRGTWSIFREFIESDYPVYLLLAHAGMGKTWELASISYKLQALNYPAFFIPLRTGFKEALGKIFGTQNLYEISQQVNKHYETAEKKGIERNIFLILDGLDEVYDESEKSNILGIIDILTKNTKGLKIILSCRIYDWMESRGINVNKGTIERKIFGEQYEEYKTRISTLLNNFTDKELALAIENYGLEKFPESLRNIAKNPFALRIIAEHYTATGNYPEINEVFMGKVFDRMGFDSITLSYFNILVNMILNNNGEIDLSKILREIKISERAFSNIMSSGLIKLERRNLTVVVKIHENWQPYITKIKQRKEEIIQIPKEKNQKLLIEINGKKFQIETTEAIIGRNQHTHKIEIRTPNKTIDTGIPSVYVSRKHLKITVKNNEIYIEDLGSTNKTYINNQEIPPGKPVKIQPNQEINLAQKVKIKIITLTQ